MRQQQLVAVAVASGFDFAERVAVGLVAAAAD